MKTLLIFATISCFIFSGGSNFAADESDDQTALKDQLVKLEKDSWKAWQDHDGKFFDNFLSDDHVEVSADGRSSKKEIVAFVNSGICQVKSYELSDFALKSLGPDAAVLTYREHQDTTCHAKVPSPCWVSSVYVKRGGRWWNAMFQETIARQ